MIGPTYNPSRYSYYAWAKNTGWEWRPADRVRRCRPADRLGHLVRLTLPSMGGLSLLLANAFLAALFWLFAGSPSKTWRRYRG